MRIRLLIPTILLPLFPIQGVAQVQGLVLSSEVPRVTPGLVAGIPLERWEGMPPGSVRVSTVPTSPSQDTGSRSPAWARFMGGFLTGTATLVGLYAYADSDHEPLSAYALFAAGTTAGAMITTGIWERPRWTLALGAAIGAAPLLLATGIDDDDTASLVVMVSWVGAPLGATLGQR